MDPLLSGTTVYVAQVMTTGHLLRLGHHGCNAEKNEVMASRPQARYASLPAKCRHRLLVVLERHSLNGTSMHLCSWQQT